MEEGDVSDAEIMAQLNKLANTAAVQEEKQNAWTFLNAVATSLDTTKVGNLKEEEVGIPKLSLRTLKELALYSRDIAENEEWANYFNARGEILTATSLSKEAKLIDLAIVQRREIANVTKPRKINKKWFQKQQPEPMPMQGG